MKTQEPKPTPLDIFIDGLESAESGGKGWGLEHEKARLLLEAAPDLLAAAIIVLKEMSALRKIAHGQNFIPFGGDSAAMADMRRAIVKAEGRAR